jgi:cbb3-type cytochrome oxidase subunit 3
MKTIALLLFMVFVGSCLLTQTAFAQYPQGVVWDPQALAQFLFPGMSSEWLRLPDVLYYVILPFIAAFTVIYGFLKELRLFRFVANKVNIVLAFCMAFLLLPSGILTWIVTILYAGSAFIGMMAFGIVFLIGIILWAYGTTSRLWNEYSPNALTGAIKDYNNRYLDMQKRLFQLESQFRAAPAGGPQAMQLAREMNKMKGDMYIILSEQAKAVQSLKAQTA